MQREHLLRVEVWTKRLGVKLAPLAIARLHFGVDDYSIWAGYPDDTGGGESLCIFRYRLSAGVNVGESASHGICNRWQRPLGHTRLVHIIRARLRPSTPDLAAPGRRRAHCFGLALALRACANFALAVAFDPTRVVGFACRPMWNASSISTSRNNTLGGGAARPSRAFRGEYAAPFNLAEHLEMNHLTIDKCDASRCWYCIRRSFAQNSWKRSGLDHRRAKPAFGSSDRVPAGAPI